MSDIFSRIRGAAEGIASTAQELAKNAVGQVSQATGLGPKHTVYCEFASQADLKKAVESIQPHGAAIHYVNGLLGFVVKIPSEDRSDPIITSLRAFKPTILETA